jgi:glycosyltransferase involved in cell wall biosynthesis
MMGGADHFNLTLVRELTARGSEVTIACTVPGEDSWCHEFARYTCDIFMLPRFLQLHDYPRFLRYLIESRQPDFVVLSNSELGYLLLPYLRSYCPGPVYLDYSHMEEPEWRQGGFPALSVHFGAYLDGSMVASHYLKKWMVERGGDPGLIQVCHINVDTQKWRPDSDLRRATRCELGIPENTVVILYAARLCRQKLPLFFAEVISALAQRSPTPFVALVVGDGEDRPVLESYLRKHGLGDRLRVLGRVPIQRMRGMMASADIFLLPSQNEGISLAIYEAMASGATVVAADVGGQRELLVPGTGFLLPAGCDAETRELYVEILLPLVEDLEERCRIGARARRRIEEEFSIEQMVENFERVCAHAAANRRAVILPENPDEVAAKAVQYVRAFGIGQQSLLLDGLPLKTRMYAAAARYMGRIYYWCLDHRMGWVIGLKDAFRRAMGVDEE